ncbi:hypothetical protein [Sinorhizobium sp. Sb3]|uniref:KGGVGR-motif variant AAA ATPase n=1 Tax=Sinorhizobium sp. Sb3 TaxID=1358417 RepID=UPI00071D030E|nr:hypothetical protein [Sinorhizobium sp. Sb3]
MAKSQVTTFYSYKGGSGRSMTLANVAWALATNEEKVLAIDWDLEAPGLHRYFHPFLADPDQSASKGLIDRIWDYVDYLAGQPDRKNRFKLADCADIVQPLELPVTGGGCLHFIGAGRQDEHYSEKVGGLDWNGLYQRFDGEAFIASLIKWARQHYTHILIDSRTGVADTAGICTTQLPDALVLCLVYNRQSIEGTAAVARSIRANRSKLRMEFIPSRVEERSAVEAARRHTAQRLVGLVDQDLTKVERSLRRAEIRSYPWCAFEEKLAVFEELPDERGSLLDAMHDLAQRVARDGNIHIRRVDEEVLNSYWRRAAFDDPRLFDLRTVSEQSTLEGWKQIQIWLDDADAADTERPEWLMALSEAAMAFACRRDNRLSMRTGENFAEAAVRLARRAYSADPRLYGTRLALVLDDMAGLEQRSGNFKMSLDTVLEAEQLWRQEHSILPRWRLAKNLDRRADILGRLGRSGEVIDTYREITEIYRVIGRRALPVGNELEPARAHRLLAQHLMADGDWSEARATILKAMDLLTQASPVGRERDAAEIIEILKTRLQIAVETDEDTFDRVGQRVLVTANRYLPGESGSDQVLSELFLCQAKLLARNGKFNEALFRIESTPADFQKLPRVIVQKAEILLDSGREQEAAELLLMSAREGGPLTPAMVDLIPRVLGGTEHGEQYFEQFLTALLASDNRTANAVIPTIRTLTKKLGNERRDFSQFLPLLQLFSREAN